MKKFWLSKNSITTKLFLFMVFLIFLQSVLFLSTILSGGVITELKKNAFDFLCAKVETRAVFLENEMHKRWSNFGPAAESLTQLWNQTSRESAVSTEEKELIFLKNAMPQMLSMLRSTSTTGAFLILNNDSEKNGTFPVIYLRDYDPTHNTAQNNDLYILKGPPEISKQFQIPMERYWSYRIELNEQNGEFFYKVRDAAQQFGSSKRLGYWNASFQPLPENAKVITYSVPLVDEDGMVFGVLGVEVMMEYLQHFLPDNELDGVNRWGYMLGLRNYETNEIRPMAALSGVQKRMIESDQVLPLHFEEANSAIATLKNPFDGSGVFAAVKNLQINEQNTPFEKEQWVLIGLTSEQILMQFVNKTNRIFTISFFCVLLMGALLAFWGSRYFTEPIAELARQVRRIKGTEPISLKRTGLAEIDRLAGEIELLNRDILDSGLRIAEIIRMVDAPIGAFEYRSGASTVIGTELLLEIMEIKNAVSVDLYGTHVEKDIFFERLSAIMKRPELDEEETYCIGDSPTYRWLRIKLNQNEHGVLGILIDVTEEIKQKNQIKRERDRDAMTSLYNSAAFSRIVEKILKWDNLENAAFVMFDLDFLKDINDTYGHEAGDFYIKKTADFLLHIEMNNMVVGRRSGDEFYAFFYRYKDKRQILSAMQDFYEKLRKNPIRMPDGKQFQIRISAGISWYKEHSTRYHELIRFADFALYKAKHREKGTYCEFDKDSYERETMHFIDNQK